MLPGEWVATVLYCVKELWVPWGGSARMFSHQQYTGHLGCHVLVPIPVESLFFTLVFLTDTPTVPCGFSLRFPDGQWYGRSFP